MEPQRRDKDRSPFDIASYVISQKLVHLIHQLAFRQLFDCKA